MSNAGRSIRYCTYLDAIGAINVTGLVEALGLFHSLQGGSQKCLVSLSHGGVEHRWNTVMNGDTIK